MLQITAVYFTVDVLFYSFPTSINLALFDVLEHSHHISTPITMYLHVCTI